MSQLCEFCLNLGFDRNIEDGPTNNELTYQPQVLTSRFSRGHHLSRGPLQDSARNGCQLCALFLRTLDPYNKAPLDHIYHSESTLGFWGYKDNQNIFSCWIQEEFKGISHDASESFCFYEAREDWDENVPPRPSFENIQDWLHDCDKNHAECQMKQQSPFIPTRLLDLDGSAGVKIIDTQDNSGNGSLAEYVALSYCWGLDMPEFVKTTTHNIESRTTTRFPLSDLPQTLADAIRIVKKLGIQYIWIDVLCILQDSPVDWETESAKMSSVYGNAYCTLSASAAPDVGTGFPVHVFQPSTREDQLFINSDLLERRWIVCWSAGDRDYLCDAPVQKRGWTLQERFLSRRVIHFLNSHLEWECRKASCTNKFEALKFPEQLSFPRSRLIGSNSTHIWTPLVEDYSQRNLTVESDKLTAIAGVASAVNVDLGDKYLAGLWLDGSHIVGDDLVEQLCWCVRNERHPRPLKYRAPSWSWAAIDGKVETVKLIKNDTARAYKALIVEVSTDLATDNPYGQVSGGFLDISGPLRRIRLGLHGDVFVSDHNFTVGYLHPDALGDSSSDDEFFCFRLISYRRPGREDEIPNEDDSIDLTALQQSWEKNLEDDDRARGLVLVRDDNDPACYRRIGLAARLQDDIFKGCPWETIRIV